MAGYATFSGKAKLSLADRPAEPRCYGLDPRAMQVRKPCRRAPKILIRTFALISTLALTACQDEAARERECYDRLAADFEAARVFGGQQSSAAGWGSDEAVSWQNYALTAAESALSISLIYSDDDRSACDYVSNGASLERK